MPPPSHAVQLSPAELSYLQASLSAYPPIRPDGRALTQFRPLIAESNILPSANGSARICFADGTEAIAGVKAEVERSVLATSLSADDAEAEGEYDDEPGDIEADGEDVGVSTRGRGKGRNEWVEVAVNIPAYRDDDALPVFLSMMLTEALLAIGDLKSRLYITTKFHWKLYIDILLLSPPLSYPLPLLSMTSHLALLSARLPRLISEKDEDPMFDDDWEASTLIYPLDHSGMRVDRPPVTLLIISVGDNIFHDPSREELAVASAVIAISVGRIPSSTDLQLLSIRFIDPPSRQTNPGVPDALNITTGGTSISSQKDALSITASDVEKGVWKIPRGGVKLALISKMIKTVLEKDGVANEVLDALAASET